VDAAEMQSSAFFHSRTRDYRDTTSVMRFGCQRVASESYVIKERRRRVQQDVNDVSALDDWTPAPPLNNQLTLPANHDHPTTTSRRHVTDRK